MIGVIYSPSPLKTSRVTADLGEALFIGQLSHLCDRIKRHYAPGAKIIIVAEGIFGRFMEVPRHSVIRYRTSLEQLIETLGCSENIMVHNLDHIQSFIPDFDRKWESSYLSFNAFYRVNK